MKPILLLFSLVLASLSMAQTKLIAFKSHSGNLNEFYELVINRDVNLMPHNLGAAPQKIVQEAQLDSVVYVDDTTAIMITSTYCHDQWEEPNAREWLWSPGADTIINHEVWNQNSPEKIVQSLKKKHYNFRNPLDSVVFVNFPTAEVEKPSTKESPIDKNREAGGATEDEDEEETPPGIVKSSLPGMGIPMAIVLLALATVFVMLYNWRKDHFKAS